MPPGSSVSWKLGAPTLALTSQEHLSALVKEVSTNLLVYRDGIEFGVLDVTPA
jgi:hypothetical protein